MPLWRQLQAEPMCRRIADNARQSVETYEDIIKA